jgi:signal transduction histidine kinase
VVFLYFDNENVSRSYARQQGMVSSKMSKTESSDFLSSLLKNIPFGIIAIEQTGLITVANELSIKYLDLENSLNDIVDVHISEIVDKIPVLSDNLLKNKGRFRKAFDIEYITIGDKYLNISVRLIPEGSIIIIDDITSLKEIEVEAVQSIIAGQENERRRIAREIHDGIGPLLSFTKLELDSIFDDVDYKKVGSTAEKLSNLRQTIDSITNDLRDLSHHLLPRLLEEFGLYSAFSSLVHKINSNTKTRVELYINFNSDTRFNADIELNIFRCGQELLNNAVKHAEANNILIQIIKHKTSIVLMVEDDGKGIERETPARENFGIGLTNVETRARTLGGEFLLESVKSKGTTASIEIPL